MAKKKSFTLFKIIAALFIIAAAGYGGTRLKDYIYRHRTNIIGKTTLYIRHGATYSQVLDSLSGKLAHPKAFMAVAEKEGLAQSIKPGRYLLDSTQSTIEIIRKIKFGYQDPQMVAIAGRIRTRQALASRLAKRFEGDSALFIKALTDTALLQSLGTDTIHVLSMIIPDSYEFFWTATPEEFLQRMKKEYDRFWTQERLQKADNLGLTREEVSVLASIVCSESNYVPEYPTIASVYLNRLKKGWKLQADPTVIYGIGDFTINRVLRKHLQTPSPYNTYLNHGLPPGPIQIPTKDGIDGVLNAETTDYMYFCASPDFNGSHLFAKNGLEHMRNAKAYQKAFKELQKNR